MSENKKDHATEQDITDVAKSSGKKVRKKRVSKINEGERLSSSEFVDDIKDNKDVIGNPSPKLEDFDFKGVRYKIVSYSFTTVYKGDQVTETVNGQKFTTRINAIINNTKSGNSITVANIMARRTDAKGTATRSLPPLVLKLK